VEVWGTARNASAIRKHPRMHACELDLTQPSSMAQFLNRMIRESTEIDLLINNAGYGTFSAFEQFPVDEITKQTEVMLAAPMRLCRAYYPMMLKRGRGAIVNVSSLAADFPLPMMPVYNASKAGLSRFTRTLQMECRDKGVCVIDFQPGDYRTGFNDAMAQGSGHDAQVWEMLEKHINSAPDPERAARDLKRALLRGKSSFVTSGGSFQAFWGPLLARVASWRVVCGFLRAYYKMK